LPIDPDRFEAFRQQIDQLQPTHRLAVFSALTRSVDIESQAGRIKTLEPTHVVLTHTDLTSRLGGWLAAAIGTGAGLAVITDSASSAEPFKLPQAADMVDALLGREDDHE
jgi:hypothetical protein